MPSTTSAKVRDRIYKLGRGSVFTVKDFADLGDSRAIQVYLQRYSNRGLLIRIGRGLYGYPEEGVHMPGVMPFGMHAIAQAIARKNRWTIQPSGNTALNLMGVSTQVPSRHAYRSSGPNRTYQFGSRVLEFKRGLQKDLIFKYSESATLVQGIKSIGQQGVDLAHIKRMRAWLPQDMRKSVLRDAKGTAHWIYDIIRKVCSDEGNE